MENTRQTGKCMRMSKYYFGTALKASCTLPKIEIDKTLFWNLCNLSEKDEWILQDIAYMILAAHHSQLISETPSAQLKEKVSCCKICPITFNCWKLKTFSPLSLMQREHSAEKGHVRRDILMSECPLPPMIMLLGILWDGKKQVVRTGDLVIRSIYGMWEDRIIAYLLMKKVESDLSE